MKAIRVIKNGQRDSKSTIAESRVENSEPSRHTNRDIAGQVAAWVKEFKQRRNADQRRTFASLFAEPASPLNSIS